MKTRNTLAALALAIVCLNANAQRTPSHPMDIATMTSEQWWDAFQRWQPGRALSATSLMGEGLYVMHELKEGHTCKAIKVVNR